MPRVVYASWHPDSFELAQFWVRQFKERIAFHDVDDHEAPLSARIVDGAPQAGTERALSRQHIADSLKDVTDFVVVATAAYLVKQKEDLRAFATSEFVWMIESLGEEAAHVVWRAMVERQLKLPAMLGTCALEAFHLWHDLRDEGFEFPSRNDFQSAARFADQLNDAVNRLRGHATSECPVCSRAHALPGASAQALPRSRPAHR